MNGLRKRREIPRETFSSIPADTGHRFVSCDHFICQSFSLAAGISDNSLCELFRSGK
jgi:hypothetical protein